MKPESPRFDVADLEEERYHSRHIFDIWLPIMLLCGTKIMEFKYHSWLGVGISVLPREEFDVNTMALP
jgi:hypothetical protein